MQTLAPNNAQNRDADLAYQKAILRSVSRTFALTIPLLPPEVEKVVGNTYLLCRIVDTIEDAADLKPEVKQQLSRLFLNAVLEKSDVQSFVKPCLTELHAYGNQDELDLIINTPTVLRILHTCSIQDRATVARCVSIMSEGMSRFHGKQNQAGLKDLGEFEDYCYVVAGVVGELLTTIFSNHSKEFLKNIKGHEPLAIAFGQALQITNILKDSPEDRARGVSWKPVGISHAALLQIAYQKLQESLQYILLIPKGDGGIRRFCFLAFGLAVMTLSKIANRKHFDHKDEVKLTRATVMTFYAFAKIAVRSNTLMQLFFYIASGALRRAI